MCAEQDSLNGAVQKSKIHKLIVSYLRMQQSTNENFFTLFLENKINGRLFYNTCLPGKKELRYNNDDFLQEDFRTALDNLLTPFINISPKQINFEISKPSEISEKMNKIIRTLMQCIETTEEWKKFWEKEIMLNGSETEKQQLYDIIAGAAAYKVLVACIDHSDYILDPIAKRNVATLVRNCTSSYHSNFLVKENEPELLTAMSSQEVLA